MHWKIREVSSEKVHSLIEEFGISKVLSKLLVQRGIENKNQAESFLKHSLTNLSDPFDVSYL